MILLKNYQPDNSEKNATRFITYALVVILAVASLLMADNNAHAACVPAGAIVSCTADEFDGFASAVDITDLTVNNGVTVDDSATEATGGVININGAINGTLLNNGTITDTGILNDDGVLANTISNLINNGTITSGENGVHTTGALGNVINNGTITGDFFESGIFSELGLQSLTNNGAIEGGTGVEVQAPAITTLINNGTITGTNGDAVRSQFGINTLVNTNTISGSRDGVAGDVFNLTNSGTLMGGVHGMDGATLFNLNNTGSIIGTTGNGLNAQFAGLVLNFAPPPSIFSGSLVNSGLIMGAQDGVNAMFIDNLTNSGTIKGGNFAIRETGVIDTRLTLLAGSNLQGAVDLGGGINTLNVGVGLDLTTTFTGAAPLIGTTSGNPFVINGNQVLVVDPTGFTAPGIFIRDLTSALLNQIENGFGAANNGVYGFGDAGLSGQQGDRKAWITGFGGFSDVSGSMQFTDVGNTFGGILAGWELNSGFSRYGFFGGAAFSRLETQFSSSETDVSSFIGGAYWGQDFGSHSLDLALIGGIADHEVNRHVANNLVAGGIETGAGEYDGWFITPSATLSVPMDALGMPAIASLRGSYTGLFLDGYTETGITNPLTVSGRDVHLLGARAQVLLPHIQVDEADNSILNMDFRFGAEGSFNLSSDNVVATLAATPVSFNGSAADDIFGFVGANFSRTSLEGTMTVSLSTEAQATLDGSIRFTGGLKVTKSF